MNTTDQSDTDNESSATEIDSEAESNREKKSPPLSGTEKQILLELIDQRKHIIEDKSTNYGTNHKKKKEWDKIAGEFCSEMGTVKRTAAQLKTWWENSKKRAKRSISKKKRDMKVTGGGKAKKSNPKSDAIENAVMSIVPSQMRSLANPFDSNNRGNRERRVTGEAVVPDNGLDEDQLNEDLSIQNINECDVLYEASTSHGKKRKYDPRSTLIDMESEEHKIRMKILAVQLQTEMIKKSTAEEMKVAAREEHNKKMLMLDGCVIATCANVG